MSNRIVSALGAATIALSLLAISGTRSVSAQQPPAAACPVPLEEVQNGVEVCVDRGEGGVYREGDPITICVSVQLPMILIFPPPPPPTIRVVNSTNGGPEHLLFEVETFSGQECITTQIISPTGDETIRADAIGNDGRPFASDAVTFLSVPR